jgi:hypothetical protein
MRESAVINVPNLLSRFLIAPKKSFHFWEFVNFARSPQRALAH